MFTSITKIIKDAKKGKMFILVDDENRENEGDLVIPANKVKHKDITFMAKHGRGLVCLALDSKQVKKLNLQLNYQDNIYRVHYLPWNNDSIVIKKTTAVLGIKVVNYVYHI